MFDFLFYNKPLMCCRCGEGLREGRHFYRPDTYEDEVYCSGCSYTIENEYIVVDGDLRASTQFYDEDIFDTGFYEIKKVDGLFVIMKYRHPDNELVTILNECEDDSFILWQKNNIPMILINEGSAVSDSEMTAEIKNWAERIFSEWTYRIVNSKMLRPKKKFFTKKDIVDFYEYCRKRIIGQDQELKKAVYMVIEYVENVKSGNFKNIRNWCLTAPSGSGKTEFYRTVRDYFKLKKIDIPVIITDLSQLTPAGYRGDNVSVIEKTIASSGSDGTCLFFLDESDKKFVHDYCNESDFNEMAQANLLSVTEGVERIVDKVKIDTSKTMFVFLGAFQNIRDDKVKKLKKTSEKRIGFGAENTKSDIAQKSDELFYENITLEDMIEYGLMEQLAGRISRVVNFHRIPKSDMKQLIRAKVDEISDNHGFDVRIEESAVDDFLGIAYTPLGIRAIINRLNELVSDTVSDSFFDSSFDESYDEIIIRSSKNAEIVKRFVPV